MKKLRLKKKTLAELSDHFPVLDVDAQSTLFGGGDGSLLNPYTESEYNILANSPYFTGGYVNMGNGITYGLPASHCSPDSNASSYCSMFFGSAGCWASTSDWTYRYTNSHGDLEFKIYTSGWKGGNGVNFSQKFRYGKLLTFEALGKKLSVIGTMFGIHDVITNIKQYQNTDDREEKWLVGSDIVAGVISLIPCYGIGPAFSIAWTFGLDDCVKQQIIYLFEN